MECARRFRIGFVMPTELGWTTHYLNLRRGFRAELEVDPVWIVIEWWKRDGLLERLPGLPAGLKARLRAQLQLRAGLSAGPFDALYIGNGHMLLGATPYLRRQAYFINTDVTPRQLYSFGALYGKTSSRIGFYERYKHQMWRERYRNARALFAWSHWTAESLVQDYDVDPGRVFVIPPGVDVDAWKCPPRTDSGPVNILFVGGDFYRKGGDLLLEWAKNTSYRDWRLHLVTRDEVSVSDPRISVYRGLGSNDPTLRQLYRAAHIFALPTRGDCYAIAGLEALAAGLPVILGQTGGTGDVVRDGQTGYLIPVGSQQALSERLEHLVTQPELRQSMGRAARADAEERFNVEINLCQTISIMRAHL